LTFVPCSAADLRRGQGVEALQEFLHPHPDVLPLAAKGHEFPLARLGRGPALEVAGLKALAAAPEAEPVVESVS